MLAFVIPLKSARVSESWETVSELTENCLRSILQQTSDEFHVYVVCHELPTTSIEHPNLTFIQVDADAPEWDIPPNGAMESADAETQRKRADGSRKKLVGILAARKAGATHIMSVDADDYISRRLAKFVSDAGPEPTGWYVERGYEYVPGKYLFPITSGFHRRCGTSHIINMRVFEEYTEEDVPKVTGIFMMHHSLTRYLADQGYNLEPLPFPGAVYCIEHGENLYSNPNETRQWAKGVRIKTARRKLNNLIKRTFFRFVPKSKILEFTIPVQSR